MNDEMKTDREKDELLGTVHTLRTYVTKLPAKMRRAPSTAQTLRKMFTYDIQGRKTEEIGYSEDDSPYSRSEFIYDAEGRLTKILTFDMAGLLKSRKVYSYSADASEQEEHLYQANDMLSMRVIRRRDDKGNAREMVTYLGDGRMMSKMVMTYDDNGREIEVALCQEEAELRDFRVEQDEEETPTVFEEGKIKLNRSEECGGDSYLSGRILFTYDESGNMTETTVLSADSSIPQGRFVYTYNGKKISETTAYRAGGRLESKERIEREFDEHGNWIKETVSSWVPSTGESEPGELDPTEIHYRTTTYY